MKEMNLHERIEEIRRALAAASANINDPWIAYALKHLDHLEIDIRILTSKVNKK